MTNEAKLRQVNPCDFYPAQLTAEIADFNNAVEQIETTRAALSTEAAEIRNAALTGKIDKPERLTADAAKLTARRAALDIEEIRLIIRKGEFQNPITEARKAERERLADLERVRREEITAGLEKLGANITRCNELFLADARVRELAQARSAASGFLKIITEDDEARLALLQSRISAAVPAL